MQNKDTLERSFLDRFRHAYQFFPEGTITKGEPGKEPDFIVENPTQRVELRWRVCSEMTAVINSGCVRKPNFRIEFSMKLRKYL